MAIAAMAAIEDAGLRVPDDVAVAGFDDIDYATLVTPSLTTVRQNQKELANALVEAVLHLLDHPEQSATESVIPARAGRSRIERVRPGDTRRLAVGDSGRQPRGFPKLTWREPADAILALLAHSDQSPGSLSP